MAWLARRLLTSAVLLVVVSIVAFSIVRLVPGDPATAILGPRATPERAAEIRARLGLDRPLPVQYAVWVGHVARGDLGRSTFTGGAVADAILARLPVTVELAFLSLVFAFVVGLPLGIRAARRHGTVADRAVGAAGLIGISVPGFWLGTILILVLSLKAGWFPSGGFVPLADGVRANLRTMALPALSLGAALAAVVLRMTRASMLRVLHADHLRTARGKGLPEETVIWRHGVRAALPPVVTIVGVQAGYLLGGAVVIEQVFSLPGLGRLALQAIESRDYPLLQGIVLFGALAFLCVNLAVDALHRRLDPRLRDRGERR